MGRSYLYCSSITSVRRRQLVAREAKLGNAALQVLSGPDEVPDEVKAAVVLFAALLDERERRLFAGVEALQFGRSADGWIADLLGIHRQTVAKGRRELLDKNIDFNRIRKGRCWSPARGKKTPEVIEEIKQLMKYETAGEPIGGLKWTRKTTKRIAVALVKRGIEVSRNTVGRLLRQMDFRLRVNHKKRSTATPRERDKQFRLIQPSSERIHPPRGSYRQRRHQEEGTGRQLPQCGHGLEAGGDAYVGH